MMVSLQEGYRGHSLSRASSLLMRVETAPRTDDFASRMTVPALISASINCHHFPLLLRPLQGHICFNKPLRAFIAHTT
jgi:hypothetical protein